MTRIARKGFTKYLYSRGLAPSPTVTRAARAFAAGAVTPDLVDEMFGDAKATYRADLRRAVRWYLAYLDDAHAKQSRSAGAEVAA